MVKHKAVRDYLSSLISTELSPGDAIPSERVLCNLFGVSRMTVRQAVDSLVNERRLERVQGSGTFVAQPNRRAQVRLTSFTQEMKRRGLEPEKVVLSFETVTVKGQLASDLEVEAGAAAYYVRRLLLADGESIALEEIWLPRSLVALDPSDVGNGSLYDALAGAGYEPTWGEDTIEGAIFDQIECKVLRVQCPHPALQITRRVFSGAKSVAKTITTFRADRYAVTVPVVAFERKASSPGGGI
ncbi:MAG: GntR family transcriptional regulator [Buchananella hordeovulneris]|nr:GntR family transcriptional regulator [Buchananella hordeovulneris]